MIKKIGILLLYGALLVWIVLTFLEIQDIVIVTTEILDYKDTLLLFMIVGLMWTKRDR